MPWGTAVRAVKIVCNSWDRFAASVPKPEVLRFFWVEHNQPQKLNLECWLENSKDSKPQSNLVLDVVQVKKVLPKFIQNFLRSRFASLFQVWISSTINSCAAGTWQNTSAHRQKLGQKWPSLGPFSGPGPSQCSSGSQCYCKPNPPHLRRIGPDAPDYSNRCFHVDLVGAATRDLTPQHRPLSLLSRLSGLPASVCSTTCLLQCRLVPRKTTKTTKSNILRCRTPPGNNMFLPSPRVARIWSENLTNLTQFCCFEDEGV